MERSPIQRQTKSIQDRIKRKMEELAKLRDDLRDLEEEAGFLADSCEEAHGALEEAVDKLSELV